MNRVQVRIEKAGYGDLMVVPHLEFAVSGGELLVLLGPNGAGKTTSLRALVGTVDVSRRTLRLDDRDLSRLSTWQLAHAGVAFVPDGARCFANATVEENLRGAFEALRPRGAQGERRRLLDTVFNLFPILHQRQGQLAGSMSGGQRQMLAIARALMIEPKLLILDEPSAGLAPKLVEELFEALGRIKDSAGCAILMAEQNFAAAMGIADSCLVLDEGHVALAGPAAEIRHNERLRVAYLGL
ncbi:ABC transporter ATP-binding protein [Azospirillum canadense]|uniref:ABC transporter ATP-binding protein n=1 Tax=Azospirillum canadense TaxID=403962 RepID=UPI002225D9D3|nr:ABC transporter ATP-binding protein [Azospirillum canadense]MCW2239221.1 branched-chain amino acid transport system ATP-binding protein [Azospirillum canadense]